jgi:peptidoglycan/LPS O-acetylase OafA/YrhL
MLPAEPHPDPSAAPRPRPALRLGYIDQMRAMAALYVAVFHALLVIWPFGGPNPPLYLRWADYGHFGVTVFIVLSGFSLALKPAMTGAKKIASYWRFMAKRALRMIPPYWVALYGAIVLLALAPGNVTRGNSGGVGGEWTGKGPVPAKSVAVFTLLLHDIIKVPSPNSPLWSIAVEWHLYFFFPFLVYLGCRYGMRWMVAGCVVVGVALHFALYNTDAIGTTPHFLALFAMGIATSYAVAKAHADSDPPPGVAKWPVNGWWLVGLSFVAFILITSFTSTGRDTNGHLELLADLICGALFAAALYLLGARNRVDGGEGGADETPVGRTLSRVGLISYSLYLVHSPTEKIVWHFAIKPLGLPDAAAWAALVVVGVGVSVAAAYVLYFLIERRSMEWSRRFSAT